MSSTNKTPNLELNQWVLTDPLLMEDMNADNIKIDTAVGANPYVKLLDTTLSANAQQVDLALSSIDLTKYAKLTVLADVDTTPRTTDMYYVRMKINNGVNCYAASGNGTTFSWISYVGDVITPNTYYDNGVQSANIELNITGIPDGITVPYVIKTLFAGVGEYFNTYAGSWQYNYADYRGLIHMDTNTRITTINIFANNAAVYIKAGSRFRIYGVKK